MIGAKSDKVCDQTVAMNVSGDCQSGSLLFFDFRREQLFRGK